MPTAKPKISGLLYNCALYSALPTLLNGIRELAEQEARGTLANLADNQVVRNYIRLKDIFSAYYGIDANAGLDWHEFNLFLSTHSFYANEIIFSPVLRSFIAEIGLGSGYLAEDLWMLRDIQDDGHYSLLGHGEVAGLFHNQFGISVRTHEHQGCGLIKLLVDPTPLSFQELERRLQPEENRLGVFGKDVVISFAEQLFYFDKTAKRIQNIEVSESNGDDIAKLQLKCTDSYNKAGQDDLALIKSLTGHDQDRYDTIPTRNIDHPRCPLSDTEYVDLYLKDAHYEIQPHNSVTLKEATVQFGLELITLPEKLSEISNGFLTSETDVRTNSYLGKLLIYVQQTLLAQLTDAAARRPKPAQPEKDGAQHDGTPPHKAAYIVNAAEYAESGRAFHNDTPAGRQTFAVILLSILFESLDTQARTLLDIITQLHHEERNAASIAPKLLDRLTTAIIKSKANLRAEEVARIVQAIELYHKVNVSLLYSLGDKRDISEEQKQFATCAREAIEQSWKKYLETKDPDFLEVIHKILTTFEKPTEENIVHCETLVAKVSEKGSWGSVIAGLLLSFVGLALIVGATLGFATSFGLTTAPSVPLVAAGVGALTTGVASIVYGFRFFKSGMGNDQPPDDDESWELDSAGPLL